MNSLSAVAHSFIAHLRAHNFRVPRETVAPFLVKLHEIFEDQGVSEEEKVLHELLCSLLQQRSELNGAGARSVLISLTNAVEVLFANIISQARFIRKTEGEHFLQKIQELQSIVSGMVESENAASEEVNDDLAFERILRDRNYIAHYEARGPNSSMKKVIVVLWESRIYGPPVIHDGMYVLYVYCAPTPRESAESWCATNTPPSERKFLPNEIKEAARLNGIIEKHQSTLFDAHSNLVAVKSSGSVEGQFFIDLIVLAKGFVPVKDKTALPRFIEGIPTRVSSGIVRLCGLQERMLHRPIVPGAGFAASTLEGSRKCIQPARDEHPGWHLPPGQRCIRSWLCSWHQGVLDQ